MTGAMSGLMGGGGGKGGSSSGGISPEQMALAQYTYGQNVMKNAGDFGTRGMGHSTGVTQADAGAAMGEAKQMAEMSQHDTQAMNQFNQQQKGQASTAIGGLGTSLGGSGGSLGGDSGALTS